MQTDENELFDFALPPTIGSLKALPRPTVMGLDDTDDSDSEAATDTMDPLLDEVFNLSCISYCF